LEHPTFHFPCGLEVMALAYEPKTTALRKASSQNYVIFKNKGLQLCCNSIRTTFAAELQLYAKLKPNLHTHFHTHKINIVIHWNLDISDIQITLCIS